MEPASLIIDTEERERMKHAVLVALKSNADFVYDNVPDMFLRDKEVVICAIQCSGYCDNATYHTLHDCFKEDLEILRLLLYHCDAGDAEHIIMSELNRRGIDDPECWRISMLSNPELCHLMPVWLRRNREFMLKATE